MGIKNALVAAAVIAAIVTLVSPWGQAVADVSSGTCARHEIVATGSSVIATKLAKIDAEIAWEFKAVKKHGLLWYSWWAAKNNRFKCTGRGNRAICVARGTPCKLP